MNVTGLKLKLNLNWGEDAIKRILLARLMGRYSVRAAVKHISIVILQVQEVNVTDFFLSHY